jgi:hypothetical protein
MYAYISPPAMVHVNKPAQVREDPITDKTGGCNNDAGSIGKNSDLPARKGNRSQWKVTGGADFYTKPAQLIGMRKGSVFVRGVAPKGLYAV